MNLNRDLWVVSLVEGQKHTSFKTEPHGVIPKYRAADSKISFTEFCPLRVEGLRG